MFPKSNRTTTAHESKLNPWQPWLRLLSLRQYTGPTSPWKPAEKSQSPRLTSGCCERFCSFTQAPCLCESFSACLSLSPPPPSSLPSQPIAFQYFYPTSTISNTIQPSWRGTIVSTIPVVLHASWPNLSLEPWPTPQNRPLPLSTQTPALALSPQTPVLLKHPIASITWISTVLPLAVRMSRLSAR